MLKTDNWLFKLILIFNILCILVCDVASVKDIIDPNENAFIQIGGACSLVALLAALYYVLMGYSKNASTYYKLYSVLYALSALVTVLSVVFTEGKTDLGVILSTAIFAFVLTIATGKDLGKRNSYLLCTFTLVCAVAQLVVSCVTNFPAGDSNAMKTLFVIRLASGIVMASMLFIMTYAKYVDKKARHSAENAAK